MEKRIGLESNRNGNTTARIYLSFATHTHTHIASDVDKSDLFAFPSENYLLPSTIFPGMITRLVKTRFDAKNK